MFNHLLETDKAYLAGIVDGEGCLQVGKQTAHAYDNYFAVLFVTQTDEPFLCTLMEKWGVGRIHDHHGGDERWNKSWRWWVTGEKASLLLECLLPYLQIKKLQAEGLVELERNKVRVGKSRRAKHSTQEERDYFEWVRQRISDLNQKRI